MCKSVLSPQKKRRDSTYIKAYDTRQESKSDALRYKFVLSQMWSNMHNYSYLSDRGMDENEMDKLTLSFSLCESVESLGELTNMCRISYL